MENYIKKVLRNEGIKHDKISYDYYFSEKTGDLYVFIIIDEEEAAGKKVCFMIVNHKILKQIHHSTIILLSDI